MNISQTAQYLTENYPRSRPWNYHSVYKTIYRGEKHRPENPPVGFLPWTKLSGEWMTFAEWIDDSIRGRRQTGEESPDVPEQPQTSPMASKRRKRSTSNDGRWGRVVTA